MTRSIVFLFALLIFPSQILISQELELSNWKGYASLLDVNHAVTDSHGNIWGCSNGGAFKYDKKSGDITSFSNIDALLSLELETVNWNSTTNEVYFGSFDGVIDIYDDNGNWTHITDIRVSSFSNKTINDIDFNGDRAFISGGFGLAVFDVKDKIFIENVPRFGRFDNSVIVNETQIYDNKIWLATTQGLAFADINTLLADPGNWQTFTHEQNNISINEIEIVNNEIFLRSDTTIFKAQINGMSLELLEVQSDPGISTISSYDGKLLYNSYFSVVDLDGELYYQSDRIVEFINNTPLGIIYSLRGRAIELIDNEGNSTQIIPNSPASNGFNDIDIDTDGNLWIAADNYGTGIGKGIMKFDGEEWINFTFPEYNNLKSNAYYWVSVLNDGRIAASNFGSGLAIISPLVNDIDIQIYNEKNSVLTGFQGDAFVVPGENRVDNNGVLWVVNYAETGSGPVLAAFTPDGQSYGFQNGFNPNNRIFNPLAIDLQGTKWLGGYRGVGRGVLHYNENNTFDDYSDDIYGFYTASSNSGLTSNDNTSIEVDKLGLVWIGSLIGLSVVINPSAVFSNSQLVFREINIMGNERINDIMIDALNNKWIATEKGVWVLNEDATELIGIINQDNSPLPTNSILSLATNENTGEIYFGTSKGLYSAESFYVKPLESFDLNCYPQPFDPSIDDFMVIEGLASGAVVRILTTNGQLVQSITTESRKTTWDGRDKHGNIVESGIYLVVTASSVNEASSVQKIAVVNK